MGLATVCACATRPPSHEHTSMPERWKRPDQNSELAGEPTLRGQSHGFESAGCSFEPLPPGGRRWGPPEATARQSWGETSTARPAARASATASGLRPSRRRRDGPGGRADGRGDRAAKGGVDDGRDAAGGDDVVRRGRWPGRRASWRPVVEADEMISSRQDLFARDGVR